MGILLACALALNSVHCVAACIIESCKPAPECHHHSAPGNQAPCSHEVMVAVANPAPAAQSVVASAPMAMVPTASPAGFTLPSSVDPAPLRVASPFGLTVASPLVLRI